MLRASPLPTAAELMILRVLWHRGPSTVRQVQEVLEQDRPTGYTTALKLLQIMHEKGLVQRDESERTHVYAARASEVQTKRQMVRDLADRVFDGSTLELILQALELRRPTQDESAVIRRQLPPAPESQVEPEAPVAPAKQPAPEEQPAPAKSVTPKKSVAPEKSVAAEGPVAPEEPVAIEPPAPSEPESGRLF